MPRKKPSRGRGHGARDTEPVNAREMQERRYSLRSAQGLPRANLENNAKEVVPTVSPQDTNDLTTASLNASSISVQPADNAGPYVANSSRGRFRARADDVIENVGIIPEVGHDISESHELVVPNRVSDSGIPGHPGTSGVMNQDSDSNEILNIRKRKLDLDVEINRAKLRLLEAERERAQLDLVSASASRAVIETVSSTQSTDDLSASVSNAVVEAIRGVGNSSSIDNQSGLLNRLVVEKQRLSFSGNIYEWLRFKTAFEHTTQLGNYSDEENALRLFDYLKGEAREAVETLMLNSRSAKKIMAALEERFGNKDEVELKLVETIRNLPKLNSGKTNIIAFASVVKNNVDAMLSIGKTGYVNNTELLRELSSKLPMAMIFRYNEFVENSGNASTLISFGDFLQREAKLANVAGTARMIGNFNKSSSKKAENRSSGRGVFAVEEEKVKKASNNFECYYCSSKDHILRRCKALLSLPVNDRWRWMKKEKRCFKCFKTSHNNRECNAQPCGRDGCGLPHHSLLHGSKKGNSEATVNSAQEEK